RNWHTDIRNAWTPENRYTDVPRLDGQDSYSNYSSTRWLTSSNYLSLQNITLGYTLPKKVTDALRLNNVRIYGSAENLFLWSTRKGLDPRQGYVSSQGATYTGSRCISGGVRVEF
ncbi:MAG: SusC/RagA family TonB-linked outer membrane protein, partial [Muribaculaceae bacterium]|nr:SusC/RagA family TonB-linked outer membrane protein [Muribaculaceae bacterium]